MMSQSTTDRVTAYRQRRNMKTLSLTAEAVEALAEYQERHKLPNRSDAILHATKGQQS